MSRVRSKSGGSSAGSSVASLVPTAVKTANYTAAASDYVPVDTTSGPVTVTLPTAPADKTQVGIKHVVRGGTNVVTIACGGSDVLNKTGGATTGTLTLVNQSATLQYKASTAVWYVIGGDLPLSQLDTRYALAGAASVLPSQTGASRKFLTSDGTNSSWKYNEAGASVIDFRKLPNGAASTITTTQGRYYGISTTDATKFTIASGRLVTAAAAPVAYIEVQCDDIVQHAWAVIEYSAVGSMDNNQGTLIGFPGPTPWGGGGSSMGIHSQLLGKAAGIAAGNVYPGSYNCVGLKTFNAVTMPYTFPGRTIRFDVTYDKVSQTVREYIDGVLVVEYTDNAALANYIGTTALLETNNQGVKVVEFGASPNLPVGGPFAHPIFINTSSFVTSQGSALPVASGTGSGYPTAAPSEWRLLTTFDVTYPASGTIEMTYYPYIICTTNEVFMELGAATGGPTSSDFYKTMVCEATTKGRVPVKLLRSGTPGTTERVGLYAIARGVATVYGGDHGGLGISWRPVVTINPAQLGT